MIVDYLYYQIATMQPEEIETSSTESDEDVSDKVIVHSLHLFPLCPL